MGTRKQVSARQPTTQDDIVLPEDEQWRIINNSGILHGVKRPSEPSLNDNDSDDERASEPHTAASTEHNREEGQIDDLFDNLFQAVLLIVPMCFLYAMMDLLCRMQYAQHPTFWEEIKQVVSVIPVISALVFYSNNRKDKPVAQATMFCISIAAGIRLVWIVNNRGFHTVINQSPPLSVIWVYTIIQLNLTPAIISLGIVYGLVKFLKLKIVFN